MQLVDELSMIYTTCVMFYGIYSYRRSARSCVLLSIFTVSLAVFITAYYHYLGDPVFHQVMFALLTAAVVIRSMHAMETTLRPSKRASLGGQSKLPVDNQEQARRDRRDTQILTTMWQMVACGLGSVAMGFLIWNLDNEFCSVLRRWRRDLGLPWGVLLEGHGWWYVPCPSATMRSADFVRHVFTGIAAYFNLTWSVWLRYCLNGRQDEVQLVWPSLLSVPVVVGQKVHGA
jgi:dihydroceramidase